MKIDLKIAAAVLAILFQFSFSAYAEETPVSSEPTELAGDTHLQYCDSTLIERNQCVARPGLEGQLGRVQDALHESMKDDFYSKLKEKVQEKLSAKVELVNQLETCFGENSVPECGEIRDSFTNYSKQAAQGARVALALSEARLHGRFTTNWERFEEREMFNTRRMSHRVTGQRIAPLTDYERQLARSAFISDAEDASLSYLERNEDFPCIENGQFRNETCEMQLRMSHGDAVVNSLQSTRRLEGFRNDYDAIIMTSPYLSYIGHAPESPEFEQALPAALGQWKTQMNSEIERIRNLEGEDLKQLLHLKPVVEELLEGEPGYCHVAELDWETERSREATAGMLMLAVAVATPAVCLLTAGLGCVAGLAVSAGISGYTAISEHYNAVELQGRVIAGTASVNQLDRARAERNMGIFGVATAGAGSAAILARATSRMMRIFSARGDLHSVRLPASAAEATREHNLLMAAFRRAQPRAAPGRQPAFTSRQQEELFERIRTNDVVGTTCTYQSVGFCAPRATVGYMEALKMGLSKNSMRKVWVRGNFRSPQGNDWDYHVALSVRGRDGNWYMLDPDRFSGPVPMQQWYDEMATLSRNGDNPGRFNMFITEARRTSRTWDGPVFRMPEGVPRRLEWDILLERMVESVRPPPIAR